MTDRSIKNNSHLIFVCGNQEISCDAMAPSLIPQLTHAMPELVFVPHDPTEELPEPIPKHLIIIDTVMGHSEVKVYEDISVFAQTKRVTVHDFDLLSSIPLLIKLHKIHAFTIIGVPSYGHPYAIAKQVISILKTLTPYIRDYRSRTIFRVKK